MKTSNVLNRFVDLCLMIIFSSMILISALQVFSRYLIRRGVIWTEETNIFCFVWLTWMGAAIAVREKRHLRMGILLDSLPSHVRRWVQLIIDVGVLFFLFLLFYKTFPVIQAFSSQTFSSVPSVSVKYMLISGPVGAGLMIIYSLKNLLDDLKKALEPKD